MFYKIKGTPPIEQNVFENWDMGEEEWEKNYQNGKRWATESYFFMVKLKRTWGLIALMDVSRDKFGVLILQP